MIGVCNINGYIGKVTGEDGKQKMPYVLFMDVAAQVERQKGITQLDIFINTPGGLIEEGEEIVEYFEELKKSGLIIHTHAQSEVYSFGADIFLVGDKRFIDSECKFMIHNPWVSLTEGDADVVEAYAKELRALESNSIKSYSEKTGTSPEALKRLMKKDTYLTPEQAVEFGFATDISKTIDLIAVACSRKFNLNPNNNNEMKNAITKEEAETMFEKMANSIKQLLKSKTKALQLKTQLDGTGDILIEFPELEDDDIPADGDIGMIDGQKANGEYPMPSGEVYVFTDGVLAITPAENEDEEETAEEVVELQKEITQLKKDLAAKNKEIKQMIADAKTADESTETILKGLQKEMKQLKKSITSDVDFGDNDGNDNKKSNGKNKGTRRLFKED